MDAVCGVPMRVGTLSQSERITTQVVAPPGAEACACVEAQAVAPLDETSGRQGDKRAWVGVAVTSLVTVWVVRLSRGRQVARALVGAGCAGMLVTDRSRASTGDPIRWRQLCWAHLRRDGPAIRERGGVSEESGDALLAQAQQMCPWWHRVREGP